VLLLGAATRTASIVTVQAFLTKWQNKYILKWAAGRKIRDVERKIKLTLGISLKHECAQPFSGEGSRGEFSLLDRCVL
jgi:hypothetical protein